MAIYNHDQILQVFAQEQILFRTLAPEEVLFHEGTEASKVYFVIDGEIRAERYLPDGRSIVFYRARAGTALSEEILHLPMHLYSAVATVESKVRSISKAEMLSKIKEDPNFASLVITCLSQRYSESLMYRELLSIKSAEERILTWLYWQLGPGETQVDLSGRMGALADELNLTRETVYRALAALENRGEIRRHQGLIHVDPGERTGLSKKN